MNRRLYLFINGITMYRLVAAPVMVLLLLPGWVEIFKWLLALSFFTDLIDGFLARRFKVASTYGARLDSIADDCTILAAIAGMIVLKSEFLKQELFSVVLLVSLLLIQITAALIRYGKMSSFHTYLAKAAAIFQGIFFLSLFFFPIPNMILFYIAVAVTTAELLEEIVLVILIPKWKANVHGIYWVLRNPVLNKDSSPGR